MLRQYLTIRKSHDINHSMRVYSNAMTIAETEPGCDIEAIALAVLLHDADDHKLFDTEGKFLISNQLAYNLLDTIN